MRAMLAVLVLALLSVVSQQYPAGIDFTLRNSPTKNKFLLETMGGGVALFDYNNDGRIDIFFVNGGRLDPAAVNSGDFGRGDPAFLESPVPAEQEWFVQRRHYFCPLVTAGRRLWNGSGHGRLQQRRLCRPVCD